MVVRVESESECYATMSICRFVVNTSACTVEILMSRKAKEVSEISQVYLRAR